LRKSGGSCDCFSASESEIIVEAGQSRNVAAEFDSSNAAGSLRIELNYRTNDPQHPLRKLFCIAEVQRG
jgi:hypothetical protein